MLGGVDPNVHAPAVAYNFEYDTTTGIWTRNKDMPTARNTAVAVTVNGLVYLIGGGGGCSLDFQGACNANEVYVPRGVQAQFPAANQGGSGIDWAIIGMVAIGGSVAVIVLAVALYYRNSRKPASSSQSLPLA